MIGKGKLGEVMEVGVGIFLDFLLIRVWVCAREEDGMAFGS